MAWDNGTSKNKRAVYSETVTLSNGSTASSSSITFVNPDKDFTAYINTGAGSLAGAVTTDLQGSFDGSTWADIDTSFAADCDGATIIATYDASASGDFPYYRLQFDSAADDSANTIIVKISTTV